MILECQSILPIEKKKFNNELKRIHKALPESQGSKLLKSGVGEMTFYDPL